jgi:hypothetical protein
MPSAPWHAGNLEERARQLIAADIEKGLTCADLAARARAPEQTQWRTHLIENAVQAYAKAEQQLDRAAAIGWNIAALRVRWRLLGDMLAGLTRRDAA